MAWNPDYSTLSDAKSFCRIDHSNDDTIIALAITAASRAVDRSCHRQFGQVPSAEERRYSVAYSRSRGVYYCHIDDIEDMTGFSIENEDGDVVSYDDILPVNAPEELMPYTELIFDSHPGSELYVTGVWGWGSVPSNIKLATLIQVNRFMSRRDAPFGIAGSPDQGSELRLLNKLDPDVDLMIGPYKRLWAVAKG